jgi:hypothetical protein
MISRLVVPCTLDAAGFQSLTQLTDGEPGFSAIKYITITYDLDLLYETYNHDADRLDIDVYQEQNLNGECQLQGMLTWLTRVWPDTIVFRVNGEPSFTSYLLDLRAMSDYDETLYPNETENVEDPMDTDVALITDDGKPRDEAKEVQDSVDTDKA